MEKLVLSINSDTFNLMKEDFNKILKRTLANMQAKESDLADITIKLKIEFLDEINDTTKEKITKPYFTHKVSSTMSIKDEKSGFLGGKFELIYDSAIGNYVMTPIENPQMSMDDL